MACGMLEGCSGFDLVQSSATQAMPHSIPNPVTHTTHLTSGSGTQTMSAAQLCTGLSDGSIGHSMPMRPGTRRLSTAARLHRPVSGRVEGDQDRKSSRAADLKLGELTGRQQHRNSAMLLANTLD